VLVASGALRAGVCGHSPMAEDVRLSFQRSIVTLFLLLAGCNPVEKTRASKITDDFGDTIVVGERPARIVSLSPATTELLFAVGAGSRVVGRTSWDLWPDSARLIPDVGNGIRPNVEVILGKKPDLVILYASQDNRSAAGRFRQAGINTLSIKMDHIEDFSRATTAIGQVIGDTVRSNLVRDSVMRTIERVRSLTAKAARPTVFWHIWDSPPITIGAGSFMNELTEIAGGKNVYADVPSPSATVSIEDIVHRNPQFVLAGPDGRKKLLSDPKWKQIPAIRDGRILTLDTLLIARPGVRLGEAALSLARALHPELMR
jgi:iron complex transport system substrate-binding protein